MAEKKEKKTKTRKEKTFEVALMDFGRLPNMIAAAVSAFYIFYFPGLPYSSFGRRGIIIFFTIVVGVIAIMQVAVAPIINRLIVGNVSHIIERDKDGGLSKTERTDLVKTLMSMPIKIGMEVDAVFIVSTTIYTIILYKFYGVALSTSLLFLFCGIFGSYIAFITAFVYTETLCSKYAIGLIKKGVEIEIVKKDKFYGKSMATRSLMFVTLFAIFSFGIAFHFYLNLINKNLQASVATGIYDSHSIKIIIMLFVNMIISSVSAYILYWQISNSYKNINMTLEKLLENVEEDAFLPTDLSNEFSYNYFLINEIVGYLHELVANILNVSRNIFTATENLSVTARETAETAVEEASSIKECLATMDSLTTVLAQISERVFNVSVAAADAKFDVDDGYALLHTEIIEKKINEITNSNIDTILGIKDFGEKIENVWNMINMIDSVAEKTKIIAFNAELEATEAGEKGEAFHIIANEIRRLATMITTSTARIKFYIKSIQEFSENLIVTSEVGTQKIREGSTFFSELEENFADLRTATDITAESAMSIQEITETQDISFAQISTTFKQISIGFDQFAQAAQYVNKVVEDLREISRQLELVKLKYDDESEEQENEVV